MEPSCLFVCQSRMNLEKLTEITSLLILAASLKIIRILRYGGTKLEISSGKGACLICKVFGCAVAFKRSLLLSSFVTRWALEYA